MAFIVNAKGLSCPEPLILAKKALDEHEEVEIHVDNVVAFENIKRLAADKGYTFEGIEEDGVYRILLKREEKLLRDNKVETIPKGKTVIVISSDTMGRGDVELGRLLLRIFIHTLTELEKKPDTIIMYNTGVLLAKKDSECLTDLKMLENIGVRILLCGTCVTHLGIKDEISVGEISNMYVIAQILTLAERLIYP
ncbi:MAG: sulfurtransferase-like selenium metabolism protein YedF [Deltaproteobacteria bacterium]|nr:sulfurtransferase-like selenium metabolism protein YedF [Deltaproteobacteria bacterium]